MTNEDKPRFAAAIGAAATTFGRKMTDAATAGYWMGLSDLSIEAVEAGVTKCIQTCKFMPVPVEIREAAGVLSPDLAAEAAWATLCALIRRGTPSRPPEFRDPVTERTVEQIGGWPSLVWQELDQREEFVKWTRKEFLRVYVMLHEAGYANKALADGGDILGLGDGA